jgi:hypothetical protein
MDDRALDKSLADRVRVEVGANQNRIPLHERHIVIGNFKSLSVGQANSEWSKWMGLHPLFKLECRNHLSNATIFKMFFKPSCFLINRLHKISILENPCFRAIMFKTEVFKNKQLPDVALLGIFRAPFP